jgi:Polyketide cyclase / dehydrase and lipid transport
VREEIEVDAPVDEVFAFFDDVANAAVLVPALVEVTGVEELDGGGRRVEYTTRNRRGEIVGASSEHVEHEPPRRTVARGLQSGIATTSTREFVATTTRTTLVVATIEWTVPVKYVAALVSAPLRGPLRRSLRASLTAAKDAIEVRATGTP